MPVYLAPLGDGRPIVMDKPILFVGRHPECDIILLNSRKVSRKHCCLAQVNNDFLVRDLGSTNGISVNGVRVRKEAPVNIGDELSFGDVEYQLLEGKVPEGAKVASRRDDLPDDEPLEPQTAGNPVSPPLPPPADATELSQDYPVVIRENHEDQERRYVPDSESKDVPIDLDALSVDQLEDIPKPHNFDEDSAADVMIIDESKDFFDDEEDDLP